MSIKHPHYRVAIVGAGIGRTHADALKGLNMANLVAVCDLNRPRALELASDFGITRVYTDYDELLAQDNVDVVILGTPHFLHASQILAAAKAGKHVLVEKPLTTTVGDADNVIEVCRANKVKLGTVFQNRYAAGSRKLKSLISNGELGEIRLVQVNVKWERSDEYYRNAPWRASRSQAGGGVLATQAIHFLDLMHWYAGNVDTVNARIARLTHDIEVEDTALCHLLFQSGALGIITASTSIHPETPATLEVHGALGTAVFAEYRGHTAFARRLRNDPGAGFPLEVCLSKLSSVKPQGSIIPFLSSTELHRVAFAEFFQSITDDTPVIVDGHEGRKTIALLDAIYRSSDMGSDVSVAHSV